jgi:hypothetical protein
LASGKILAPKAAKLLHCPASFIAKYRGNGEIFISALSLSELKTVFYKRKSKEALCDHIID